MERSPCVAKMFSVEQKIECSLWDPKAYCGVLLLICSWSLDKLLIFGSWCPASTSFYTIFTIWTLALNRIMWLTGMSKIPCYNVWEADPNQHTLPSCGRLWDWLPPNAAACTVACEYIRSVTSLQILCQEQRVNSSDFLTVPLAMWHVLQHVSVE